MGRMTDFIFLGSKITANGNCSHDIKRCLLLGRKVMTNINSILKSRDITLPAKVHRVKAVVSPAVMYRCEGWTIKKDECQRINAFELWCQRRLLRVPWTARSNQSILKEINFEYSLERLMQKLKLQYFGHLIWRADSLNPDAGKVWRQKEKGAAEDEMDRWHHRLSGNELEQTPSGCLVCCSPRGCKSQTWLSDWTTATREWANFPAKCIYFKKISGSTLHLAVAFGSSREL